MKHLVLSFLLILPSFTFATDFKEGEDYQLVPRNAQTQSDNNNTVTEFFSYGCPWCFKLEPTIEKLAANLPKNMQFNRVPVVFEPGWDIYAKAYYTVTAINMSKKITPLIFDAIHKQKKELSSVKSMSLFLVQNGVPLKVVNSAFNTSPTIDAKVKQGMLLMQSYGINSVPSIVIGNKYKTDLALLKGDEKKLIAVSKFLIKKIEK